MDINGYKNEIIRLNQIIKQLSAKKSSSKSL